MVYWCCVPFCGSKSSDKAASLHTFTTDKKLQKIWIHNIQRDTRKSRRNHRPFLVTKHTKICSLHFAKTDFIIRSPTKKVLKKHAIPVVFPWSAPMIGRGDIGRSLEYEAHQPVKEACVETALETTGVGWEQTNNGFIAATTSENQSVVVNSVNVCEQQTPPPCRFSQKYCDFLMQYKDLQKRTKQHQQEVIDLVTCEEQMIHVRPPLFYIEQFKNSDKKFSYYTGFPNHNIYSVFLGLIFKDAKLHPVKMNLNKNGKQKLIKLPTEDQLFLTLIKLRQNFDYEHLSTLFQISVSTVECVFTSWINFLYLRLGSLDIWPHRDILLKTFPVQFCEKYPNVIGFIYATEFYIQTPSSLERQSQTYSEYESHNTMKGLVVTDANGAIIFISALFTGSISDTELLQQSGFINVVKEKLQCGYLASGDIFLADKDFRTHELLHNMNIHINIPVFRVTGLQFTPEEVDTTRTIAHERIYVERAIRRLKSFKILTHEAPISLMGTFSQLCTVCALLLQFRFPLSS